MEKWRGNVFWQAAPFSAAACHGFNSVLLISMWLTLTLSSFVAFLAAMLTLTRRGFTSDGSWRREGAMWATVAAAAALIWAVALSRVPPPYPMQNLKRYEAPRFRVGKE